MRSPLDMAKNISDNFERKSTACDISRKARSLEEILLTPDDVLRMSETEKEYVREACEMILEFIDKED